MTQGAKTAEAHDSLEGWEGEGNGEEFQEEGDGCTYCLFLLMSDRKP